MFQELLNSIKDKLKESEERFARQIYPLPDEDAVILAIEELGFPDRSVFAEEVLSGTHWDTIDKLVGLWILYVEDEEVVPLDDLLLSEPVNLMQVSNHNLKVGSVDSYVDHADNRYIVVGNE